MSGIYSKFLIEKKHKPSSFVEEIKVDYRKSLSPNDCDQRKERAEQLKFLKEYGGFTA